MLKMLTLNELPEHFPGTRKHFWYQAARSGRLPTIKAGRKFMIAASVAELFLLGRLEPLEPEHTQEYGKIRRIDG